MTALPTASLADGAVVGSATVVASGAGALASATVFALVTDRAGLDSLEADWNDLFARAGRPTQTFQTFGWNWHWANHYFDAPDRGRRTTSLAILTARRQGRLVSIWPLVLKTGRMGRVLSFMGAPVSQYGDILLDDVPDRIELMSSAWAFINARLEPDVVWLRKVRADAEIAPLLAELDCLKSAEDEAPYIDLGRGPDGRTYQQRQSSKAHKNRRRLMRRLEDRGTVTLQCHSQGHEAREAAIAGIAMKRAWLEDRGLLSEAFADRRFDQFFADVAEGREQPAGCSVFSLNLNGRPLAIAIGLACKQNLAVHVITYDLGFEKAGVGILNVEAAMRQAAERGFEAVDLLAPKADYKKDLTDATVPVADHAIPVTKLGALYARLCFGRTREQLKALAERLPRALRRRLAKGYAMLR